MGILDKYSGTGMSPRAHRVHVFIMRVSKRISAWGIFFAFTAPISIYKPPHNYTYGDV